VKLLAILAALAGVTGTAAAQGEPREVHLPLPAGPLTPAVRSFLFVDSSRTDLLAPDPGAGRPILVTIWYPSDAADGERRRYMDPRVAEAWRGTIPVAAGFEDAVIGHALGDAPISTARDRWPVLLFSHGRSFPVDNYQIALEHMASMGWVVAAISHPYEEAMTVLPDGRALAFSGPSWEAERERGPVLMGVVDELVLDARHVIDRLERMDRRPGGPFTARLDLADGVGYFGHSLGGAAAVWTMDRDERVTAAASWEGQVYRDEDRPLAARGPLLYFIAGANRSELAGTQFRPAAGGGPVYELVLHGAWHPSFGDMLHIYRAYADRDWLARHRREMDALRANQISADYLHEFFAHYLLGEPLDLLWPDSVDEAESYETWGYPEVELRVYAR
jgi:dienelactone hydrolase